MEITDRQSPNCEARAGGHVPELVVLHYTAMEDAEAALSRLCDPEAKVSAHYLIGRDGAIWRLVPEDQRAWHAGSGSWGGHQDINSRSIGIELDNDGQSAFPDPQFVALEELLGDILERHGLPPKAVIAHSDMAPDRKSDPGRKFDWQRLAAAGLSIWPDPALPGDFLRNAAAFGYAETFGEAIILEAFRQRFRPDATGPLDAADRALMAGLARQHPADVTDRGSRRIPSRPLGPMG